ncbi:hypothetical protein [Secundilactobacillus kimchicus]|uniref:hypothetical protein n=1 Tax=Secundilactobacillus kimchicus TaxID=528209 RepID=UPI0024A9C723|nr:hypothetical protein [Secundilactobacillus kimchicus]
MKKGLRRTLFIGMATLSVLAVGTLSQSKDASAKSYPTVQYNRTMTSDGTERNVITTGSNALYNKAGTLRGARKIATTTTMRYLGNSDNSRNYFRAYRVARTSRGSIYYKVVSFDQKYRGWIYGGRSALEFGGGIQSTQTTRPTSLTGDEATKTYQFASPGTTNVTWQYPSWTQYKAGKVIGSTASYATDDLTIDRAVTKTREGSKFYYVRSAQHPSINGWIYSKAVKQKTGAYDVNKQVQVTFKNPATNTTVATTQWTNPLSSSKQNDDVTTAFSTDVHNVNSVLMRAIPSGYTYDVTNPSNVATLQKVLVGQSIVLNVKPTTGVNQFSLTDAVVYNNPTTIEPNQSTVSSVRRAYQSQILGSLGLPYSYDASVANNTPGILRDLGNGRTFTVGSETYTVKVSFSNANVANVQLIRGTVRTPELSFTIANNVTTLSKEQKELAETAVKAGYNHEISSVQIWSTMTEKQIKEALEDGKSGFKVTAKDTSSNNKEYVLTYSVEVTETAETPKVKLTLTNVTPT